MTRSTWLFLMICLFTGPFVWASGYGIYEQGAQGMGNLGAFTARAEGPSAIYHNPAGIARLDSSQISFSARTMATRSFYSNPGQSTWDAKTLFDAVPNFYLNFKVGKLSLGLGSSTIFHYHNDWEEVDFPGRFAGKETEFTGHEHMAAIAFRISERFSIGATYRLAQVDSSQSRLRARPLEVAADQSLFYETLETFDGDGDGSGFSVGFQYYVPRRFGLGLTYWSAVETDLSGNRTFQQATLLDDVRATSLFEQNFRDAPLTSDFELPERIALGFWTRVTVRTRVEIDLSTESWSAIENTVYNTSDTAGAPEQIIFPRQWDDSYSLRIAGDFQQRKAILWRAAIGTFNTPVPDETLQSDFVDDDRFLYSFGVSYTWRQRYILEAAWMYIQNRDRSVTNRELRFDPTAADYLSSNGQEGLFETQRSQISVGIRYKFGKIAKPKE